MRTEVKVKVSEDEKGQYQDKWLGLEVRVSNNAKVKVNLKIKFVSIVESKSTISLMSILVSRFLSNSEQQGQNEGQPQNKSLGIIRIFKIRSMLR